MVVGELFEVGGQLLFPDFFERANGFVAFSMFGCAGEDVAQFFCVERLLRGKQDGLQNEFQLHDYGLGMAAGLSSSAWVWGSDAGAAARLFSISPNDSD